MAILEPLAFDGAPDVEVQALLAGQQSPVACCKRKSQCTFDLLPSHFPVAWLTRALVLQHDDRARGERARDRDQREDAQPRPRSRRHCDSRAFRSTIESRFAEMDADRDARDGPSSSVFPPRVSLRAALHSRDTPRCTAAGHIIVVLASPRLDSPRGPREREKLPRTGNRAKSNGEITLPHRFIEKWTFPARIVGGTARTSGEVPLRVTWSLMIPLTIIFLCSRTAASPECRRFSASRAD